MRKIKCLLVCALALCLTGCSNTADNSANGSVPDSGIVNQQTSQVTENSEDVSSDAESEADEEYQDDEIDETEETDYTDEAEYVLGQVDTFFEALTAGDIDTLIDMCDEEQEYYEYLVKMGDFDCTPAFLRALYGNTKYCFENGAKEELIDDLESAYENGEEYISVEVTYSSQYLFLLSKFYTKAFEDGTFLEDNRSYKNNDEAIAELEKVAALIPYGSSQEFYVKLAEDGKVLIAMDPVIDSMEIDEIGRIDEKFPIRYAEEVFELSSDVIVGDIGKGFYEDNDFYVEFDRLLAAKDFAGLGEHISNTIGEDIHAEYAEKYGSYEELTDEQKAFVDDFIENEFKYELIGYTNATERDRTYQYRKASFLLVHPKFEINNPELTQWYFDNGIKDFSITYDSMNGMATYKEFLWRYYYVIQYAKNNK